MAWQPAVAASQILPDLTLLFPTSTISTLAVWLVSLLSTVLRMLKHLVEYQHTKCLTPYLILNIRAPLDSHLFALRKLR